MSKATNTLIMDAALNALANAVKLAVCSAQPLTYYEGVDAPAWAATTATSVGDAIRPTTRNGYCYECTASSGSTGAAEPTWPTTPGNTVVDGGVTWTCRINYNLAQGTISGANFTLANGSTSGRQTTLAAQTGLSIVYSGTATHVATLQDSNKAALDVTTCTSQALTAGGTVDTSAFAHQIEDPV